MKRKPAAPHFYPGNLSMQIEEFLLGFEPPLEPENRFAGIVPHAGWACSGAVAAKAIRSIGPDKPDTFVIFGAVHSWGARDGAVYPSGAWDTPLGEVAIDEDLAQQLLDACGGDLTADPSSHSQEHSIEVQVPMIRYLFPGSKILPIATPPTPVASAVGKQIGTALAEGEKRVAILGSTDLTHYGANYGFSPWGSGREALEKMRANDRRIIDLALWFQADKVVAEASAHSNACGAGAIAATLAAAKAMGADKASLIEYTTSHDVLREPNDHVQLAVGYAGIVFGN